MLRLTELLCVCLSDAEDTPSTSRCFRHTWGAGAHVHTHGSQLRLQDLGGTRGLGCLPRPPPSGVLQQQLSPPLPVQRMASSSISLLSRLTRHTAPLARELLWQLLLT